VIGVAPEASIYAIKALNNEGTGYVSDIIEGIEWAIDKDLDIVNLSLGTGTDVQALHDVIDKATRKNIIVVAAAGNDGKAVNYPAKYTNSIAVSALDSNNNVPSWSSRGSEVSVAAPGVSIYSTWNDGGYKNLQGTSMATPHVSGLAALTLGESIPANFDKNHNKQWEVAEVRNYLQKNAKDLGQHGKDNLYGYGLIQGK